MFECAVRLHRKTKGDWVSNLRSDGACSVATSDGASAVTKILGIITLLSTDGRRKPFLCASEEKQAVEQMRGMEALCRRELGTSVEQTSGI